MKFIVTLAVFVSACTHLGSVSGDDAAILSAVTEDPFLHKMVGEASPGYLDRTTSVDFLHPWVRERVRGPLLFEGTSGEAVYVESSLFRDLLARNRIPASLGAEVRRPAYFSARDAVDVRHVDLSRPGWSPDGTHAIVAVRVFTPNGSCPAGYTAYLAKTAAGWKVIGHGAFWVV